jgi:hypothetical protein
MAYPYLPGATFLQPTTSRETETLPVSELSRQELVDEMSATEKSLTHFGDHPLTTGIRADLTRRLAELEREYDFRIRLNVAR